MSIASLAMYPFPTLQPAYDELWTEVRSRLTFDAPDLDWQLTAAEACRRSDLLLGHTCGWPLITELANTVEVVGTFDCDVDQAADGTYRSVLIARERLPVEELLDRPGLNVAANGADSLSGWITLRALAAQRGITLERVLWTGAHAASIDAVRHGRADLASIDAVTWAHLADDAGDEVVVVGHGLRVPCLPLVTSVTTPRQQRDELRAAFAAAIDSPTMAAVRAKLRIRRFVERDREDYETLAGLAPLG